MMRLEEAVYAYLISQPAIHAKIGNRIFPLLLPQKSQFPAATYTLVSVERTPALQKDTGYVKATLQFSCHAKSYSEAVIVTHLLRIALQDFSGNMNGVLVGAVFVTSEMVDYEPKTDTYTAIIEFEFHFNEK